MNTIQSPGATYAPNPPTPTVGRAVHFWTESSNGYKAILDYKQPHAATITYVHPGLPQHVNLQCIDHNGNPYTMIYVPLEQSSGAYDGHGTRNYATWPDVQFAKWPGVSAAVAAARERAGEVG